MRIPASASPRTRQHRSVHPLPPCLRHRVRCPRTPMEIGPAAVPPAGGSSGRPSWLSSPKAQTPTRSWRANRASRPRCRTSSRLRIVWGEILVSFRARPHQTHDARFHREAVPGSEVPAPDFPSRGSCVVDKKKGPHGPSSWYSRSRRSASASAASSRRCTSFRSLRVMGQCISSARCSAISW